MRRLLLLSAFAALFFVCAPARAQFCPGVSPWVFDDVAASDPFCGYITWMAENGITLGCQTIDANHRLYCPNANVTRAAMAAFMNRLGNVRVEAVGTGPGLTGGPITGIGTINLAPTQLLPTTACASGQMPVWNGNAWACGSPSGGTVTSVATGTGLTGGPITGSGTIAADTAYLQRRVSQGCAVGSAITAIAADGTVTCAAVGAGTVTSVATGSGLTGGPITGSGTVSIANGGVTKPMLSAAGGANGQMLSTDGTNLAWSNLPSQTTMIFRGQIANIPANQVSFVFIGPTAAINVVSSDKVLVTASAVLGFSPVGADVSVDLDICYLVPGGVISTVGAFWLTTKVSSSQRVYSTNSIITTISGSSVQFGMCARNTSPVALNANDYVNGSLVVFK